MVSFPSLEHLLLEFRFERITDTVKVTCEYAWVGHLILSVCFFNTADARRLAARFIHHKQPKRYAQSLSKYPRLFVDVLWDGLRH